MIQFSPPVHLERSLPSNRTTASDGGQLSVPGVATAGSGRSIPDLYSTTGGGFFFCFDWPTTSGPTTMATAPRPAARAQRDNVRRGFMGCVRGGGDGDGN